MKTIKRYESMDFPVKKRRVVRKRKEVAAIRRDVLRRAMEGEFLHPMDAAKAMGWKNYGGFYGNADGRKILKAIEQQKKMGNLQWFPAAKKRSLAWHIKAWWQGRCV